MRIGPFQITTTIDRLESPPAPGPAPASPPRSGDGDGESRVWAFPTAAAIASALKPHWPGIRRSSPVPLDLDSDCALDFDSPLFQKLSPELQDLAQSKTHLWEYLNALPWEDIGVPGFSAELAKEMRDIPYRNLIYPVAEDVFIHLYPDPMDSRDYYLAIEPSSHTSVPGLMDQVNQRLINYINELRHADDSDDREETLLRCLDQICTFKKKFGRGGAVLVTERELEGLRYLILRDKQGLGNIEPIISDPYVEDVTCSGVGPLFVEHRIFGGLKSGIAFESHEELDHFVIQLSEKIGRPVTVREPIVDAVLPDGSRVNIVFGGDVSKRGSNFTIRKFSATPLSVLDLVDTGTVSYEVAAYLSLMVGTGMNVFVSGETASGKTTLLNAITTLIPPNNKIVSIEDTAELQVPHPNWTREVIRGKVAGGSSVTMFDLLKAAMRQRPNEIIIGEIRGEEGAIAFQAMQTGHACMATFHAASVEKLIQRLTGNPINVPKTYIDNLNLVIIMSAVRLPDGSPGRRVMSVNEIISYDSEANAFNFIEVFRWNPATDSFEFPGYMNAMILERVVAVRRGLAPKDSRKSTKRSTPGP